ncbi:MAG: rod shape-determining protein MreC [Candidatus Caenarcaniphilales bacterium]|nr:rod shape-determining protein MreC [Candidatus Caenarcaniphilales bacterium]
MQFNKKNNRLNKIIVNSIVLSAVLIFLSGPIREVYIQFLKFTSNFNQSVSTTVSDGIERSVSTTKLVKQQKQELEVLEKQAARDKYQLSLLSTLANKVDSLDKLLVLKKNRFPQSIAASVIARSPSSWHQQVVIDKGSSSGIEQGMIVVTPSGILGQAQEVKPNYAIVQLVSSSQLKFGAEIQRTRVMGILFGDKPGYAQLKFVPIGSDVKKGDIVQTTSVSSFKISRYYPFAYPVGKVISVTRLSNNSEMFIRVKLFENATQAYDVLVLLPGGDKPSLIPLPPNPDLRPPSLVSDLSPSASVLPVTESMAPISNVLTNKPISSVKPTNKLTNASSKPLTSPNDTDSNVLVLPKTVGKPLSGETAKPLTKPVTKPLAKPLTNPLVKPAVNNPNVISKPAPESKPIQQDTSE